MGSGGFKEFEEASRYFKRNSRRYKTSFGLYQSGFKIVQVNFGYSWDFRVIHWATKEFKLLGFQKGFQVQWAPRKFQEIAKGFKGLPGVSGVK